jgi:hypothetical protein
MAWWYEIRGSDDRLIETRREFASQEEAHQAAQGAKRLIENLAKTFGMHYLTIVMGEDEETTSAD